MSRPIDEVEGPPRTVEPLSGRERRSDMLLNLVRWALVIGLTLVVLGLIAYARGPEHRRGDDVGALGPGTALRA